MALDLLLFASVLAGIIHGSRGGTAFHVTGVLAIVGGATFGVPLAHLCQMVTGMNDGGSSNDGLSLFVTCFAAIWLTIHLVGVGVRSGARSVAAGTSDRLLGGAVGLVHGVLACLAAVTVALVLAPSLRAPIQERPIGRVAQKGVDAVAAHLSSPKPAAPTGVDDEAPRAGA